MTKYQTTLNFNDQLVRSQKAYIMYDPFKMKNVYFVPRTSKTLSMNASNKRKLFLAGDLELHSELFINNRFVKDSKHNCSHLARDTKLFNPLTKRYVKDTPQNKKKIEKAENELKVQRALHTLKNKRIQAAKIIERAILSRKRRLETIKQKTAAKIIQRAYFKHAKPTLVSTSWKTYYDYSVPAITAQPVKKWCSTC